jgi:hypothetical protein
MSEASIPNQITMEMIELEQEFPNCSDPSCELDASVYIVENGKRRPWCTGHAHIDLAMWMVGL